MTTTDAVPPLVAVIGVAGSGKTTVGAALAGLLGVDFVDGDDLHPAASVEKMHRGQPLTDDDRWPWLDRVGGALADASRAGHGLVMACSALKRAYRDRIRTAGGPGLVFVFLDVSQAEARRRMVARLNHFMPPALLDSQFDTLEQPEGEADVLRVDLFGNPAATARDVASRLATLRGLPQPQTTVDPVP